MSSINAFNQIFFPIFPALQLIHTLETDSKNQKMTTDEKSTIF